MLEKYFEKPTRIRQLRRGPLGPHLDDFAAELQRGGFAPVTARHKLCLAAKFSDFVRAEGGRSAAAVDDVLVSKFLEELALEGVFLGAEYSLLHLLEHLRRKGVTKLGPAASRSTRPAAVEAYDVFLRDVRGLQPSTRSSYAAGAARLVKWLGEERADQPLAKLTRADVLAFMTRSLDPARSPKWRSHLCSQTRCFLRYLGGEQLAPAGLERSVPSTPVWRLATIPRHLPWPKVRQLIDSVDTSHSAGLRDKAVLLVLAMLGLRTGEVRRMKLADVRWRVGELHLPKTKSSKERVLPLSHEVGAALADYVLHGRPAIDVPEVFLRHRAPQAAFESSGGVGAIVADHLRRSGIDAPSSGGHLLRHSLATRLVNVGVPIKTIADVLGHQSIDTSAIYTKVETTRLVMAAMPFPKDGGQ
jgi:site-specific recombinase XerD